jgi:hypothetical protein
VDGDRARMRLAQRVKGSSSSPQVWYNTAYGSYIRRRRIGCGCGRGRGYTYPLIVQPRVRREAAGVSEVR